MRPLRRGRPPDRPGADAAAPPRLDPRRDGARCAASSTGSIDPGDVFILNDPYEGGTHLPDFYLFKPIFVDERLVGWSASIGHQTDVGGKTAGRQRLRRDRDLPGGPPHPAAPALRRRASRSTRCSSCIDKNVRVPRQVLGDVARAGGRLPHRRARLPRSCSSATARERLRRVHRRPARPGRAPGAQRHHGHARRRLHVHRLHRRRRHRPRPDPDRGDRSRSRATA